MGGLIDPRIVNRPPAQPSPLHSTCPAGYKTCCYAPDLDLSVFQRNHQCISPLAAHKLKNIAETDLLKVRVGEWDASGFNAPEQQAHEEYTVVRILKHPGMSTTRLSDNIAIPTLTETSTSTIPTSTLLVCPPVTTSLTTSSAMGPGSGVMWQGGARTRLMAASSSSPRRLTCL